MRRGRAWLSAGVAALALAGCAGEDPDRGLDEPMRVSGATFKSGELPGEPPPPEGEPEAEPRITVIESVNNVLAPGQGTKTLLGRAVEEAVAVGVRFDELGTGYWVLPTGSLDPAVPGERVWALAMEVDREVPPGLHAIRMAAFDEDGAAGTQAELNVCVTAEIPDNLNACDPTIAPPAAVLSLAWDNTADLDLGLITPKAKFVDSKHPTTATGDPPAPDASTDGIFDMDANAACSGGLKRRESLVWQNKPTAGPYAVYVNLFDPCGEQAARFVVTLHLREERGDGTFALVERLRVPGQLLAAQANGGSERGLFVTSFEIK